MRLLGRNFCNFYDWAKNRTFGLKIFPLNIAL